MELPWWIVRWSQVESPPNVTIALRVLLIISALGKFLEAEADQKPSEFIHESGEIEQPGHFVNRTGYGSAGKFK